MNAVTADARRVSRVSDPHSREHRKRIEAALIGICASLEHKADPELPEHALTALAVRRAKHAYDQLGQPRVGQLLPNRFGKAVLIPMPDDRMNA